MKRALLSLVAVVGLVGSASAADLGARPVYKAAPMPAPAYSWTGFYIGAGGGYGFSNQDISVSDLAGVPLTNTATLGGRGWFGTVQVGADYQFAGNFLGGSWLIGAFADYDFGGIKGDVTQPFANVVGNQKEKSKWAAGGRLGYVPFVGTNLLTYVSGGYTEERFNDVNFVDTAGAVVDTLPGRTRQGWFIGTGYEYGLNFLPGLFWKTEYRYSEFQGKTDTLVAPGGAPFALLNTKNFDQTIRSELVYRFNWGSAPVVAKY